jgi:hypothetical protein
MNRDTERYLKAAQTIMDGRDPVADRGAVMVTLEGTVAAVLVAVMGDHEKAAAMLNEGLVEGVESRLALGAKRRREDRQP